MNDLFRSRKIYLRFLYIYEEYMVLTKLFHAHTYACMHLFGVIFLHPLPSSMFVSFTVDSMIRGNHVYKDV